MIWYFLATYAALFVLGLALTKWAKPRCTVCGVRGLVAKYNFALRRYWFECAACRAGWWSKQP